MSFPFCRRHYFFSIVSAETWRSLNFQLGITILLSSDILFVLHRVKRLE